MNRLHWPVLLLVKCRITCLRVTLRELETFCTTFDDFGGWTAHQIIQIPKYWRHSRQEKL